LIKGGNAMRKKKTTAFLTEKTKDEHSKNETDNKHQDVQGNKRENETDNEQRNIRRDQQESYVLTFKDIEDAIGMFDGKGAKTDE